MEASCYLPTKPLHFCSSLTEPKTLCSNPIPIPIPIPTQKFSLRRRRLPAAAIGCGKGGGSGDPVVVKLERELEEEMMKVVGEDEWVEISGRWREKCEGGGGIVELLECLEREAIMGEDEGRDPTDYNRRALIFDKSSRVFQALKEKSDTTTTTTPKI